MEMKSIVNYGSNLDIMRIDLFACASVIPVNDAIIISFKTPMLITSFNEFFAVRKDFYGIS